MKLSLEEYSDWVSRELEKQLKPTRSKGSKLVAEAVRTLGEAQRFFEDLSRKGDREMTTKRDPVSYRAARVIGHSSRKAIQDLSKIQAPQEASWDSVKSLRDSISLASRSLRDLRNEASIELSGLYILDMRSFAGINERIAKVSERLTQFLEGEGTSLLKGRTLVGVLTDIQTVREELGRRLDEAASLSQETQDLSTKVKAIAAELDRVSGSGLLRETLDIERELRKESNEFRTATLAHLQRPLRRLRDLAERGEFPLGSEDREALDTYVKSPYRSFLSKKTGQYLVPILQNLRQALENGKLGFKPRKTTRVLSQLDQLLRTDHLVIKQRQGRDLLSRRWKLLQDPECKALNQARDGILLNLGETRKRQAELLQRTQSIQEKAEALSQRISELLTLAETKTKEYVGREVVIAKPFTPKAD